MWPHHPELSKNQGKHENSTVSTSIISLLGLYKPLVLSVVCHLKLSVLESQMAKELSKYLLAFKPLGFE